MKKVIVLITLLFSQLTFANEGYSTTIGLEHLSGNTIVVSYQTLPNTNPSLGNHWVGLWKGHIYPRSFTPELQSLLINYAKVNLNQSSGHIALNGLDLLVSSDYTLIYFLTEKFSAPASIIHFRTSNY